MLKPVLLLVDDDPAVLEAIEAELRPHFGEVLRIEAFTEVAGALEACTAWQREGRLLAVAVVDERMPDRTGIEFLRILRTAAKADSEHPARFLEAVVLTGYAGLEAAMVAKNETGIHRYLEKPWRAVEVQTAVRSAFAKFVARSATGAWAEFVRLERAPELRRALALRHEVYSSAPGANRLLPAPGAVGLDIDEFDRFADQFGISLRDNLTSDMVGTLRIVGESESSVAAELRLVFASEPEELQARLEARRTVELPLLKYLEDRNAAQSLLGRLRAAGEGCVEPGRLTVHPDRRAGVGGQERHLARLIIDGAVAHAFFQRRVENALLTCIPQHFAFYRPFGFREAEGTSVKHQAKLDVPLGCYHGRIEWVPEPAATRCASLARRLESRNHLCRCGNYPACAGRPYETGNFSGVDLFCPVAARDAMSHTAANPPQGG